MKIFMMGGRQRLQGEILGRWAGGDEDLMVVVCASRLLRERRKSGERNRSLRHSSNPDDSKRNGNKEKRPR